jgi:hypothetical protein
MRVSTSGPARRSCSSASALKRVTNTPCLIGIEMFILATFPGDIIGSPMRSMMGFASSPSSKRLRPAGFPANAQNSSARVSSSWAMAVSEVRRSGVRPCDEDFCFRHGASVRSSVCPVCFHGEFRRISGHRVDQSDANDPLCKCCTTDTRPFGTHEWKVTIN